MAYPKSFIEEIKYKNNIADVIGRYVTLKRSGSNLSGLCPFHSERSPSFTVFHAHYHCFGCGAGGDVITFTMQMEGMTYPDAVKSLADRAGIQVPQDSFNGAFAANRKKGLSRERGYLMNKAAARIFHENLSLPEAAEARAYLEKRGLSRATLTHFGIGFALNDFSYLIKKLKAMGFTEEEMKENSLCGISQNGRYYDFFRNRVIFPVIDTTGNVVAFGGRVMDDSKPKYLNSSDTPVFKKSRTLFALNFAKNAALGDKESKLAGKLIMCEGYMDVIALHASGFTNAVATLGTAVTPDHARIISRYAKNVYLAYDSDEAGQKATKKAIALLSEAGIESKSIKITGAKDPDEFIKRYGGGAFMNLLEGALGQIDYSLGVILAKYDLDLPDGKAKAIEEACDMLAGVYPAFKREIYVSRLSEISGVSAQSINHEIARKEAFKRKSAGKALTATGQKEMLRYNDRVNPEASAHPKAVKIEEAILGMLLINPELIPKEDILSENDFITEFDRGVFVNLKRLLEEGDFDIGYFNEMYSPEEVSRIVSMMQKRRELTSNGASALKEQIDYLKAEKQRTEQKKSDIPLDDYLAGLRKKHNVKE